MGMGIPGQIVDIISEDLTLATVEVSGERRTTNIAFVVDDEHPAAACLNEWVLVHFGFAMQRIDASEAAAKLAVLRDARDIEAARLAHGKAAPAPKERCALVKNAA